MADEALDNISMDYWDRLAEISREKWDHDRLSNQLARKKNITELFNKVQLKLHSKLQNEC